MLLRGANAVGYTSYADNVVKFVRRLARYADVFRVFDSLNYIDNLKFGIDSVGRDGGGGTICYTGDVSNPKKRSTRSSTTSINSSSSITESTSWRSRTWRDSEARAATMLVGALREKFPDLPIHVHTHDTAYGRWR